MGKSQSSRYRVSASHELVLLATCADAQLYDLVTETRVCKRYAHSRQTESAEQAKTDKLSVYFCDCMHGIDNKMQEVQKEKIRISFVITILYMKHLGIRLHFY